MTNKMKHALSKLLVIGLCLSTSVHADDNSHKPQHKTQIKRQYPTRQNLKHLRLADESEYNRIYKNKDELINKIHTDIEIRKQLNQKEGGRQFSIEQPLKCKNKNK